MFISTINCGLRSIKMTYVNKSLISLLYLINGLLSTSKDNVNSLSCNSQSPPAALHFSLYIYIILLTTNFLSSTVIDILSRLFLLPGTFSTPILQQGETQSQFSLFVPVKNTKHKYFWRFLSLS